MTECRLCGEPIHFSDSVVSKRTGKKIPLSEGSDDPHSCAEYKAQNRRYYPCRECNAEIYFDDAHISKNGKHIPLSKATGEPHECEPSLPNLYTREHFAFDDEYNHNIGNVDHSRRSNHINNRI